MYLSVLIPFFNEDDFIEQNILQIIDYLKPKFEFEILIINDSGKKNQILESISDKFDNISIINNSKNFGKGYSIRKGISFLRGKLTLITDSDLATPITEFDKLHNFYNKKNHIVIGSRSCIDSEILTKQPFYRIIIGRIYNILIKIILGLNFNDTQCGFKLFDSSVLRKIIIFTKSNRFGLDIELIYFAKKNNYKIYEIGVKWKDQKKTSVSVMKDSFQMFFEILKLRLK